MKQYYPIRDRGVYRAAANPKSKIHEWGKELVDGLKEKDTFKLIPNILAWCYRNKGYNNLIKQLIYKDNPLLSLLKKINFLGDYIPIPIKIKDE